MTIEAALEVFVGGYSQIKSQAHPYVAERLDGLWVMRDGPGRKKPRKIEVVSHGWDPAETVERLRRLNLGWHFLSEVHTPNADFEGIRATYKSLGYRAISTEWLFVHPLFEIPANTSNPPVRLVTTQAEADAVPQLAKHKRRVFGDSRLYGVWDETRDYGWVRSVPCGRATWVSGLHVHEDARGRGFGRALMSAMLEDDRRHGVETSVLLASSDGARLYPHLGYEKLAILQMFCPANRG